MQNHIELANLVYFLQYGNFTAIRRVLPSQGDQPRSNLTKKNASFHPMLLALECFHGTMASTGHCSTISISWCQTL